MAHELPPPLLKELSDWLERCMGLHFPQQRWTDLERGLLAACREFKIENLETCARWLLASPLSQHQIEVLAHHLTIGETYFFRDRNLFASLENDLFPALIRDRLSGGGSLRIWSAGCCTGEEPYSIAVLLSRLVSPADLARVSILATDINPHFLAKASGGVYNNWSLCDTSPAQRERYFEKLSDHRYRIIPSIKSMVKFAFLNLAEDEYPSARNGTVDLDMILCRNVIMYFSQERMQCIVRSYHGALRTGGWMIVSPSEASQQLFAAFTTVNFPGSILYRKDAQAEPQPIAPGANKLRGEPHTLPSGTTPAITNGRSYEKPKATHEPAPLAKPAAAAKSAVHPKPAETGTLEKASSLYGGGRYAEVVALLEGDTRALRTGAAAALMARCYANLGNLNEALKWAETASTLDKLNAGYHYLKATILLEQDAALDAAQALNRALFLDPRNVMAHFALGNLARRQGDNTRARRQFANASRLLHDYHADDVLPESDGISAGRLASIIETFTNDQR